MKEESMNVQIPNHLPKKENATILEFFPLILFPPSTNLTFSIPT